MALDGAGGLFGREAHLHDGVLDRLARDLPRQRAQLLDRRLQKVRFRQVRPLRAQDPDGLVETPARADGADRHFALPALAGEGVGVEGGGHGGGVAAERGGRGGGAGAGWGGERAGGGIGECVGGFEDGGGGEVAALEGGLVGGGGSLRFAFEEVFGQGVDGVRVAAFLIAEEVEEGAVGLERWGGSCEEAWWGDGGALGVEKRFEGDGWDMLG